MMTLCLAAGPPKEAKNVETIAASFVPPKTGSAVRLFNLASDVGVAELQDGRGKALAEQVKYSLGSSWSPVPSTPQTFCAFADTGNATTSVAGHIDIASRAVEPLASAPFTPPSAPQVFTAFLIGSKAQGYTLVPQLDAPETGPCKPPSSR